MITDYKKSKLLDKYRDHLKRAQGGIFTKKTRKRLLGEARAYGGDKDRTIATFWSRTAKYVRNALIDLELFIETGQDNKVREEITAESLEPIVNQLLLSPVVNHEEPDEVLAEIASLFISSGFGYLRGRTTRHLSLTEKRSIDEAVDLSEHLAQYFKPEAERRFPMNPR